MKKFGLYLALCAALSFAVVTAMSTPVEAAKSGKSSKKASKSKAMKVTVNKPAKGRTPVSATYFNNCASGWGWLTPVAAVGCGAVFAIPVMVETMVWRA